MAHESSVHTVVDREKTPPFLIRAFVKINGFHRISLFEDGTLPTTDEHQLFTWRDTTLPELITALRIISPTAEFRHPLARFSFRALFADSVSKGHFSQKDLGQITSRDMLEENLLLTESSENRLHNRTLEELRFVPGDYLSIAVVLPKNVNLGAGPTTGLTIKGSAGVGADANGRWGRGGPTRSDSGWGGAVTHGPPGGLGRGGAHWRARPGIVAPSGRGGGDAGRDDDRPLRRDRDRDREPPPPRIKRESPPPRIKRESPHRVRPPIPERDRDYDYDRSRLRRSRTRSRSRSPRRRGSRYD
ncbi:Sin3 associated polypeptide p18-domain-containing protein [Gautieria morchelliformis]|nr:Sin3 associated polypeptide p18-domain-containing protein [Gautieria morchelliformis]